MHSWSFEALQRLGFNAVFQAQLSALQVAKEVPANAIVGRVASESRGQFSVWQVPGEPPRQAVLAGRLEHGGVRACVGDFVLLEADDDRGLARIVHLFERSSIFRRKAPGRTSDAQLLAANIDLALVVCALAADDADPHAQHHGLNPRRIERYLWAIRDAPARACVVVNKADLSVSASAQTDRLQRELRGVPVVCVSAEQGDGMAALEHLLLPGATSVLVGSSGVGKSSLTNRLLGATAQAIGAVRQRDTRGRHTTTGRELFLLPNGSLLIDTPGMREFGLFADDDTESGVTGFEEIDALAPACHFRDCKHHNEPGCAVLAAVEAGQVTGERLEQAHKLERELTWQRDRHDPRSMSLARAGHRVRTRSARALQKRKGED